jgi:uncharacterized RDD family membrane protein YckC
MQPQFSSPSQAAAPALEYVGVGRRFVALIIDAIIFVWVSVIIRVVFPSSGVMTWWVMTGQGDFASRVAHISLGTALQIIMPFVYFIVMEALLGATVGKMALGIRVVKLDGSPISWWDSIVRNLWRIIDSIPGVIPYLLGALLILTSPTKQRLGDRLAQTVVVRRRSARF